MFKTNKKKVSVVLFLIAFIAFGVAGYAPPKPIKKEGFKNLQVLPKDISEDDLDHIMDGFKASLGVKCGFCHVHNGNDWNSGWDFAADDKDEKGIARYMMKMTKSINANHFNFDNSTMPDTINVISCNTCHRGIPHPDAKGIMDQKTNGGVPPPPPAKN